MKINEANYIKNEPTPQPIRRTKRFCIPKDQRKTPQEITSFLINFMKQQQEINKTNNNFNK